MGRGRERIYIMYLLHLLKLTAGDTIMSTETQGSRGACDLLAPCDLWWPAALLCSVVRKLEVTVAVRCAGKRGSWPEACGLCVVPERVERSQWQGRREGRKEVQRQNRSQDEGTCAAEDAVMSWTGEVWRGMQRQLSGGRCRTVDKWTSSRTKKDTVWPGQELAPGRGRWRLSKAVPPLSSPSGLVWAGVPRMGTGGEDWEGSQRRISTQVCEW